MDAHGNSLHAEVEAHSAAELKKSALASPSVLVEKNCLFFFYPPAIMERVIYCSRRNCEICKKLADWDKYFGNLDFDADFS